MNNYWKEIWERKGEKDTNDLVLLDGFEKTDIDSKYVAEQITKQLGIKETDCVLEVGCGAGLIAQYLKCDYYGVDYSSSLIEKHKKLLGNKVSECDAAKLIFDDNKFDYSFSYSVFFYFDSKEYVKKVIDEMKRVTKKRIFIGDLPMKSHRKEHLLFKKDEFEGIITDCFYNTYRNERFNVLIEV